MNEPIPFFRHDLGAAEVEAFSRALADPILTTGDTVALFERRFAAAVGRGHAVAVTSCTGALHLSLIALGIGPGDEVITTPLTFIATSTAIFEAGATPVLVDVEPDTYCLNPSAVEAAITPRTRAVIAVHLYNSLADLDALLALCKKHDLHLVEDCAHSHGSSWNERGVGSLGAIGCFSFQLTKSLTAGEGGFCTTNSDTLQERLDSLRNCGRRPDAADDRWSALQSGNYRLSEWQAAILSVQLTRFSKQLAQRAENARLLDEAFAAVLGMTPMRRRRQVTRQGLYAYVVRYDKDAFGGLRVSTFRERLSAATGVPVGAVYQPLNDSPLYQPQTKPRYRVGEQWAQLDPTRFELPVATHAYREESVVIPHEVLLTDWNELSTLVATTAQIQDEAGGSGGSA